jgi:hypothetical protein
MALGKRRQEIKRLVREAKARKQGASEAPAKPPKEVILPGAAASNDTETTLPARGDGVDPSAETEAAFGTEPALPVDAAPPKPPPDSLPFDCPCGAKLSAPRVAYDKKTRCPSCNRLLLLNLIEDPHGGPFRIEPFQAEERK